MTATAQHMTALQKGNGRRLARAAFKRSLRGLTLPQGRVLVADLLDGPPPEHLETMKVYDLLRSMHRAGPAMASRWMFQARIAGHVRLDRLTERQAGALQVLLRDER